MIINNLVTTLYSKKLLSGDHKDRIESLLTDREKAEYFLDRVIKPGLEIKFTEQFDEMLRVMRTSDDCTIAYLVDEMQKFISDLTRAHNGSSQSSALAGENESTKGI